MIGKKLGQTYDVVAFNAVVYDIVGQTYDIVYDIIGNIEHMIGKKLSKTYDIVGFSYENVGFFQYSRF